MAAYEELSSIEYSNPSILHIFLILKSCGFNDRSYIQLSNISTNGLKYANYLSILFTANEEKPLKYEFINPFSMKVWDAQAPSETLRKWVSTRIKNNVVGGATTWRRIIIENIGNDEIKFTFNYIEEIRHLTLGDKKINLFAISVWYYRFHFFETEVTPSQLINGFINDSKLDEKEIGLLFESKLNFKLTFSDKLIDSKKIRERIGLPPNNNYSWLQTNVLNGILEEDFTDYLSFKKSTMNKIPSIEKILALLKANYQIILTGPPGTSKSYIANSIGEKLLSDNLSNSITKIQFHPQYSYQDFIGGFIVNGEKVEFNRGVLLKVIEKSKNNPDALHLIIIDEINRANLSSVFGETIQCLDRLYKISITLGGKTEEIYLPKNLLIIGTMNSSDRTLGSIDFALKRRFLEIYIGVNEDDLINTTKLNCEISAKDFLSKINKHLRVTLQNNELVIGHTIFYNDNNFNESVYLWSDEDFENLFNYKILPIIEDFCNRDVVKVEEIVGVDLSKRLTGVNFIESVRSFLI